MKTNKIHYCPVGLPHRQFGIYVTGAGKEVTKPGEAYPHPYHSSDYYFTWRKGRALADWEYQLLYIREGKGVIQFKRGRSIQLSGGSLVILHPGEWHRYRPDQKTGWSEAYIGFGGAMLERIFAKPFFSETPTIVQIPSSKEFEISLLSLVDEIQAKSAEQSYSLAAKTLALVGSVIDGMFAVRGTHAGNAPIRKANLHIAHHLAEVIDFPALAKKCGMSYSLFRKRFRDYNGLSPLDYQIALRVRRAMHLLSSTDFPAGQIAEDTGFNSPAYFSKVFRARTGFSPTDWRQRPK